VAGKNSIVVPVSLSVVVHVVLLTSMIAAFDFHRPMPQILVIQGTLVPETADKTPPPVVEKKPEPEPVIEEPPPEPDNSEELRRQAEEEKRIQDALIEKERLEKIRQQEEAERKKREREEAERRKREREEAERKKAEEQRKERERQEAERKREEDIQRQREENERLRKQLEAEARQAEIDAEANRQDAVESGELAVYMALIRQKVERNWSAPASAGAELKCSVRVRQVPGGEVTGVTILSCNGNDAVKRSVEAAIFRSSPLPEPSDPSLFDRNILLNLSIRQ